jgi:predicted DNA-binding protein (MmcQ/YjbR family)
MITVEQARAILSELPVVEEGANNGNPDFRVKNKMFATFPRGMFFVNLRVGEEEVAILISERRVFSVPEVNARGGWVSVKLDAVTEEQFLDVAWKAWRYTAPPRLSLQY